MRKPSAAPRPGANWLSPTQAADYIGVSLDTIYDACKGKGLRSVKLGHSTIRIKRAWLDEWMEARATA